MTAVAMSQLSPLSWTDVAVCFDAAAIPPELVAAAAADTVDASDVLAETDDAEPVIELHVDGVGVVGNVLLPFIKP